MKKFFIFLSVLLLFLFQSALADDKVILRDGSFYYPFSVMIRQLNKDEKVYKSVSVHVPCSDDFLKMGFSNCQYLIIEEVYDCYDNKYAIKAILEWSSNSLVSWLLADGETVPLLFKNVPTNSHMQELYNCLCQNGQKK